MGGGGPQREVQFVFNVLVYYKTSKMRRGPCVTCDFYKSVKKIAW